MNAHRQERNDHLFVIGLLAGTFAGAGLAMLLAPRTASELRQRAIDSAKTFGKLASDQYQQASTRVGEALDDLTTKSQLVCDDVAAAVARGAGRFATAAKSDPQGSNDSLGG